MAGEHKAVVVTLSASTVAVRVEKQGLELLRGRERFHLDEREVVKLLSRFGKEG